MKHFDIILLRKKITETDLYIQELVLRKDLAGKDRLVLYSQACLVLLWKFIAPEDRLELKYDVRPLLKTAYTSLADEFVLRGEAAAFSTAFTKAQDGLLLASADAEALKTAYSAAADVMRLLETIRDMETVKYLSFKSEAVLIERMNSSLWQITKYASMRHLAALLTSMAAYLTAYAESDTFMELLSGAPSSRLVRFRLLGEIGLLTLDSIQDTPLDDLIFDIIE